MRPNFSSRPRIVDAEDAARQMRSVFADRNVEKRQSMQFSWPDEMQHVGQSIAVAYASDKWKNPGDYELYKHLHDGLTHNRALCSTGFLHHYEQQGKRFETIGPVVSFAGVPMPQHFAVLGLLEEVDLRMHVGGTDDDPKVGRGDNGIVKVIVAHAMLGAGVIRWSVDGAEEDEPFVFVYSESSGRDRGGVHMIIVGDELDIEKDGIVG